MIEELLDDGGDSPPNYEFFCYHSDQGFDHALTVNMPPGDKYISFSEDWSVCSTNCTAAEVERVANPPNFAETIEVAVGDYLIFSDGDCIPRHDFVATHVGLARHRCGLSGGCIRLPAAASHAVTAADILSGRCMQDSWMRQRGLSWRSLFKAKVTAAGGSAGCSTA